MHFKDLSIVYEMKIFLYYEVWRQNCPTLFSIALQILNFLKRTLRMCLYPEIFGIWFFGQYVKTNALVLEGSHFFYIKNNGSMMLKSFKAFWWNFRSWITNWSFQILQQWHGCSVTENKLPFLCLLCWCEQFTQGNSIFRRTGWCCWGCVG